MSITLNELRRFTVARNFFRSTTLKRALNRMEFVQADPIRAPARAQDLILRHRVTNYRAGDLERRYASLDIEEDVFVNYGFVARSLHKLMHPRSDTSLPAHNISFAMPMAQRKRAKLLLEFIQERGVVHPREVDEYFSHGTVTNWWGGSSNATTHLLEAMHYNGLVRVVRREKGIRIYAARQQDSASMDRNERHSRIDALVDTVVRIYAPLPAVNLSYFVRRLRYAVPQWKAELKDALLRAKDRLAHAYVVGNEWYWPANEDPLSASSSDMVRFLAPFDPVVNDRERFETLWGWVYRFEAYTPALKRKLGYYAMPLLWRDQVIGWANVSVKDEKLESQFGYVASHPPRDRAFKRELAAELERMRTFLNLRS
jgi:hypothetical protein